ncbi:MAG: transglutaminase domain-containing protein [Candidatus Aenigmarchaeota archaeon]|nr:transglutaminase domain-containing protein [Candidatus Aenigmarchaeota archaeon]
MKGTVDVWIWILGGVLAGLLILAIANSYLTQTTKTIAEQRSIEQHDELRTQINELCWSSSENKKQYAIDLNENVLGVYLTEDKYVEYDETQFIDFILDENVSSGNLLCMKIRDKRLLCEQLDCNARMTFLGSVPTESSLSALIDNIIGNPGSFEYKLSFSKFGKEVLISVVGGKEVLPVCNLDGFCNKDECRDDCEDCYGPSPVCIGDDFCNRDIGEDCLTSLDCICNASEGYNCCKEDPASDDSGCVDETRQNLSKGEECFCQNECNITANLVCSPVAVTYIGLMKSACCEPGYGWNGSDCVMLDPCLTFSSKGPGVVFAGVVTTFSIQKYSSSSQTISMMMSIDNVVAIALAEGVNNHPEWGVTTPDSLNATQRLQAIFEWETANVGYLCDQAGTACPHNCPECAGNMVCSCLAGFNCAGGDIWLSGEDTITLTPSCCNAGPYQYHGDCDDYAHLYISMARTAGVSEDCVAWKCGPGHAFNAAKINGRWEYVDAQGGQGLSWNQMMQSTGFIRGCSGFGAPHSGYTDYNYMDICGT